MRANANLKTLSATAAIAALLAVGPALYASAQTPNQKQGSGGMMQGGQGGMMGSDSTKGQGSQEMMGGQGGMMNMMQQMSQMMGNCNQMMKDMTQNTSPATPKQGQDPDKKG